MAASGVTVFEQNKEQLPQPKPPKDKVLLDERGLLDLPFLALTVLLGILLMQMLLQSETLGWRLYSARNKEAHEVRLTFADGGIWVRTRVEETRMDYGAVTGLFEDAGYLVVRMKHHTPLVVPKADVPGGQADALRDMLCRKTGQTVRRLRP